MNEEDIKVWQSVATKILQISIIATSCKDSISKLKEDMLNNKGTLAGYTNRLDNINLELDKIAIDQEAVDAYKDIMSY